MLGIKIQMVAKKKKKGVEICKDFNLLVALPCAISLTLGLGMCTGESERLEEENSVKRTRVFECMNLQCVIFLCLHPKTC